jgi:hypothetical protein
VKRYTNHRDAYRKAKGCIPDGMHVRHTCDNTRCVNPDHLILGTHQDNMNDGKERNRFPRGEAVKHSKLTWHDVRMIRLLLEDFSQEQVASVFGVSQVAISKIARNKTWKVAS